MLAPPTRHVYRDAQRKIQRQPQSLTAKYCRRYDKNKPLPGNRSIYPAQDTNHCLRMSFSGYQRATEITAMPGLTGR